MYLPPFLIYIMSKSKVRRISEEAKHKVFRPPEPVMEEGVEVRYVSDERAQHEHAILLAREAVDNLVEQTEEVLRRLDQLGFRPTNQQAVIAYTTLMRASQHFKILQTEAHNFRGQ